MRCALAVRRVSGVVHVRALCKCAREPFEWTALRGARWAPSAACAWRSLPRALTRSHIVARLTASSYSFFLLHSLHETLPVFFSPLRLCTSAPLRFCFALVSAVSCLRKSAAESRVGSASAPAAESGVSASESTSMLCFGSASSSTLLCILLCSSFGSASVSALGSAFHSSRTTPTISANL